MPTTEERLVALESIHSESQSAEEIQEVANYDINDYHLIFDPDTNKILKLKGAMMPMGSHKPYSTVDSLPDPTDPNSSLFVALVHSDPNPVTEATGNGYYVVENDSWKNKGSQLEKSISSLNTTKGVSGSAVYNFFNNKCFVNVSGLSSEEEIIQNAIFKAEIWGENVDPENEEYYLSRIALNRDTYNDNYFQLKRTDGTLIAFSQWDYSSEDTGVKTYEVNNYLQGYNFKFIINWDLIPHGTNYTSGSLSNMKLDRLKCHIDVNKGLDDLPLLNLQNYQNKVFKRFDNINYTDEEISIRNAVLNVEVWGKNVASTDTFYLERIGYDRTGSNDVYFYVKKSDETVIAVYQKAKSNDDEGVTKYVVNEYLEGYNVSIVLNWSFIPNGTDYVNGEADTMLFDNSNIYINAVKKESVISDNKVIRKGDKVYIMSKWNNEHDLLITFNKCMFNDLMTFSGVSLIENTDSNIIEQIDKVPDIVLNEVDSDNIGPYIITGVSSWVGGNHGYEGDFTNLSSNYTGGDSTLNVADGTKFVTTGGWARTDGNNGFLRFQYSGVSGNQLTGVSGLNVDLITSDQVQVYHRTAETEEFEFYVNGEILPENIMLPADELIVTVKNKILDSSTLNFANGNIDTALYENVMYRISKGNIEVLMEHEFIKDISITVYYGMQLLSASWQQKVYQANSQNTAIQAKGNYPKSGDPFTFQSDKMIIAKSNDIYNCAMWFDPNCGYSQNKANYLDSGDYLWNGEANGKFYHGTILKATSFIAGQKEWWRGVYTWFPNPLNIVDASYAYEMRLAGRKYLCIDFHSAGNDNIPTIKELGKEVEVVREDSTLTSESDIMPNGLNIVASGYGSGLYKVI
jgi:hypothetical protein